MRSMVGPEVTWTSNDPSLAKLVQQVGGGDRFKHLVSEVFPDHTRIVIEPLSPGISGAKVFKAFPVGPFGRDAPSVVKVGSVEDLEREKKHWEDHVRRSLPHSPDLFAWAQREGDLSVLVYKSVGSQTLGTRIERLVAQGDWDTASKLLKRLFQDLSPWHESQRGDYRTLTVDDYPLDSSTFDAFSNTCELLNKTKGLSPRITGYEDVSWLWSDAGSPHETLGCLSHGDLHSNNVMIDDDGTLTPIDFADTTYGHFLRDFVKLETDLVFRVLTPSSVSAREDLRHLFELQEQLCSEDSFTLLANPPANAPASAQFAYLAIRDLRRLAWGQMRNRREFIPEYFVGILRHAIRMAERNDNGLSKSQRWLAAHTAVIVQSRLQLDEGRPVLPAQPPRQTLSHDQIYVRTKIPQLVRASLKGHSIDIDDVQFPLSMTVHKLVRICRNRYPEMGQDAIMRHVRDARAKAFEEKYAFRTETEDERFAFGIDKWQKELLSLCDDLDVSDLVNRRIVNVGMGNGLEAPGLFDRCRRLVGVDISAKALNIASGRCPQMESVVNDAEDLIGVRSESQDIYLSLRTYQSTLLDIEGALLESHRVLKVLGKAVISVPRLFIDENGAVVEGLLLPETEHVDKDLPYLFVDRIRRAMGEFGFEDIGVRTGLVDVYVYGEKAATGR